MIEKNDILYAKEGNPIKKYVFSEIIHSSELKLMLDSCVWEKYSYFYHIGTDLPTYSNKPYSNKYQFFVW